MAVQNHRLLFSHASVTVRGENTQEEEEEALVSTMPDPEFYSPFKSWSNICRDFKVFQIYESLRHFLYIQIRSKIRLQIMEGLISIQTLSVEASPDIVRNNDET